MRSGQTKHPDPDSENFPKHRLPAVNTQAAVLCTLFRGNVPLPKLYKGEKAGEKVEKISMTNIVQIEHCCYCRSDNVSSGYYYGNCRTLQAGYNVESDDKTETTLLWKNIDAH
ncbi:hypothetical protein NECAME_09551 [Necator americanus]|uniref:Uncharacterized protein n=1 Tax=Necator americanus TaxID=51031 RepID=W2TFD5_NECAM|nr:hypothetical protein NECAME_09551 [Necator americanus]ETN79896.1 hypothetical protein NECAME_09551 [Necator americanus]